MKSSELRGNPMSLLNLSACSQISVASVITVVYEGHFGQYHGFLEVYLMLSSATADLFGWSIFYPDHTNP
jgi:hypothetical protein